MQINLWSKIVCISWKENSNNKKKEYYKERTKVNANINNIVKTEKEKKGIWIWIWMKRNRSKKKYVYKKIRKRDERKNQSDWKGKWRNGGKRYFPFATWFPILMILSSTFSTVWSVCAHSAQSSARTSASNVPFGTSTDVDS